MIGSGSGENDMVTYSGIRIEPEASEEYLEAFREAMGLVVTGREGVVTTAKESSLRSGAESAGDTCNGEVEKVESKQSHTAATAGGYGNDSDSDADDTKDITP
jgi:hypothetical protein